MRLRIVLAAVGTALVVLGAGWLLGVDLVPGDGWVLTGSPPAFALDAVVSAALWLGGGVLAHDALLAPLTVLVCWLGTRLLPGPARGPAALVLLVWGSVTVMALPVLSGQGRGDVNPTLTDRPYGLAWLGLTLVAAVVAVAWGTAAVRGSDGRSERGADSGSGRGAPADPARDTPPGVS